MMRAVWEAIPEPYAHHGGTFLILTMSEQAKLPVYVLVALASIFIIMLGIKSTASIINPILLAMVITIAVIPLPHKLIKRGMSRKVAFVITILAVVGAILLVIILVVGSIYALKLKMPSYAANIAERSQELSARLSSLTGSNSGGGSELDAEVVSDVAGKSIGIIANAVVQMFMTLLIFVFMLSAALTLPDSVASGAGESLFNTVRTYTSEVSRYVTVTTVINFLVGLGDAVFLMVLGVDFAILWGLLAWFLGYIPTIGFWIALIPPTILAWAEHGMTTAIIVFIGFVLINGSVQNFVQPKMMGNDLNISPIIVFLSLFIWGWLLGAIGAILAVPMTLLVLTILDRFEVTRRYVQLLRPGSGSDADKLQAKKDLSHWWGKFKSTIGVGHGGSSTEEAAGETTPHQ